MSERIDLQPNATEDELVSQAQTAVSRCNWVVGACAAEWTKRYARGRTDADFGNLVGLSSDQVYQRRRVWEMFGDVYEDYPRLKWSHFYLALNWDDATDCLAWADENETTVAEMRAWRRAQRGEDLAAPPLDSFAGDPSVCFVPSQPTLVRDPQEFVAVGDGNGRRRVSGGEAREAAETPYAPYRKDAGSPASQGEASAVATTERPQPSAAEILKRAVASLERINRALSPELTKELRRAPRELRERFVEVVGELSSRAAAIG
ncbi:MAG: hypothetical protein KY476_12000 [Planctomycetes bacterium]|nr:hypothetical protein [Planctomycetota bacterium]